MIEKLSNWEKGFTCGVAWACALVENCGGHQSADQIWRESGMSESDLDVVDPQDAALVRRALRSDSNEY